MAAPDGRDPAAADALSAAVEVESQATLAVTLLAERVDRSGKFTADGSVSMAAWLRESEKRVAYTRVEEVPRNA